MIIKHTEWLSNCFLMSQMDLDLWLTPGSSRPYWASHPSFRDDYVVATPWDFLEEAGYTAFNDGGDYDECDEQVVIVINI